MITGQVGKYTHIYVDRVQTVLVQGMGRGLKGNTSYALLCQLPQCRLKRQGPWRSQATVTQRARSTYSKRANKACRHSQRFTQSRNVVSDRAFAIGTGHRND